MTQVVSGFLLSSLLLLPTQHTGAYVLFDDGGVHVVNDDSLMFEYIELRNGTTLRLEPGAVVGGAEPGSGLIDVFDQSSVVVVGGQVGGDGPGSGSIILHDVSQLLVEGGSFGGAGPAAGQVAAFDQSTVMVLGGHFGGTGAQAALIGFFDQAQGRIEGGTFGGSGEFSGLIIGMGESLIEIVGCDLNVPDGPVTELSGIVFGSTKDGQPLSVPFMREEAASLTVLTDCGDEIIDTDGDGVPDDRDLCPRSDLRPKVWIGRINTRIPNLIQDQPVDANGCSLADHVHAVIREAAAGARTWGQFVRAVSQGLRELRREGILPARHHDRCLGHIIWFR